MLKFIKKRKRDLIPQIGKICKYFFFGSTKAPRSYAIVFYGLKVKSTVADKKMKLHRTCYPWPSPGTSTAIFILIH